MPPSKPMRPKSPFWFLAEMLALSWQCRSKGNISGGARERRRREPLGGCWGMLPQKILKSRGLEMLFPAFSKSYLWFTHIANYLLRQEPMRRSMQLNYISVTAFSYTDLLLDRIYFEWDSRGRAITNHKILIDVTVSLDRNYLSFTKEKGVLKID